MNFVSARLELFGSSYSEQFSDPEIQSSFRIQVHFGPEDYLVVTRASDSSAPRMMYAVLDHLQAAVTEKALLLEFTPKVHDLSCRVIVCRFQVPYDFWAKQIAATLASSAGVRRARPGACFSACCRGSDRVAWEPERTLLAPTMRTGGESERAVPHSTLRIRKLPLLRGFSRFPISLLSSISAQQSLIVSCTRLRIPKSRR